uniref:Uncharacterized protein LOC111099046 isoform X2 n=1 Tax=Crassostrea virginica TaxID=6565 RepID=A0A8B8A8M6_CRAVI|nr:uncharacterized protein LOC111099046 isoform X2 [Crassostrea virginica]
MLYRSISTVHLARTTCTTHPLCYVFILDDAHTTNTSSHCQDLLNAWTRKTRSSVFPFFYFMIAFKPETFFLIEEETYYYMFYSYEANVDSSPLTLKTEDVGLHLHEEKIVLNCTYSKETNEAIFIRSIRWKKQIGNTFKNLACFTSPGGIQPFIEKEMESLYYNRTELIAPTDGSPSAILILKELVCDDAGEYQCLVDYVFDKTNYESTSPSTVAFKATQPTDFTVFPNLIKENQSLTLSCSADVGAPNGSIKIWKLARNSNVTELIFTSNTSENNTENCKFVNVTFNYTVSRDENVTLFRCSSQNILNKGVGPSLDLQTSEKYGPDETSTTIFSCDRCGRFENCHKRNGEAYCVTNPWMAVAVISICLCATFVVITYFLIKHRKSILGKPSTKSTSSRPERKGAMLPHPDEHAEITTTCNEEYAQYVEVQKKQKSENVYDPNWNENELVNLAL